MEFYAVTRKGVHLCACQCRECLCSLSGAWGFQEMTTQKPLHEAVL